MSLVKISRTLVGVGSLGLISVSLFAAAPAANSATAAASPDYITASAYPDFRITATQLSMPEAELLEIMPSPDIPGSYLIRVRDDAQEVPGRPLLIGGAGCTPFGFPSTQIHCTPSGVDAVNVDFSAAAGPTNVAIMDNAPIALNFTGSASGDYVQGGGGNDRISGAGGNDFLFGGDGDDIIEGSSGNDVIEGEAGRDDMRGGSGSDSIDAADGIEDARIDCGGLPESLDYDKGKDVPQNCDANITPITPEPVEPTEPPAPGEGSANIDGVSTDVTVAPNPDSDGVNVDVSEGGPRIFTNLMIWDGDVHRPAAPAFRPETSNFRMEMAPLFPRSTVDVTIWLTSPTDPATGPAARTARTNSPISTTSIAVGADGAAQGSIPVPQGQQPGDYVIQINGVTKTGAAMTVNVGVTLTEAPPTSTPSIALTSVERGTGKKARIVTVKGSVTGLDVAEVTPRYRTQGAKKWVAADPVAVTGDGTFTWRIKTAKKVRIQIVSGDTRSSGVVVRPAK